MENPVVNYNAAYLLELLSAAINEAQPPEPGERVDFDAVYKLAETHDILNTTCYAVDKLHSKPNPELLKKWEFKRNQCVHRNLIQTSEFNKIRSAFEKAGITYMPVKGFDLSKLYPQPDYRFMSDLDILIREEELKKADEVMLALGYTPDKLGALYDDSFIKLPFMHIELHHMLFSLYSPFHDYYNGIIDRGLKTSEYGRALSPEDSYIYTLAHMYKHYKESGTGIRSIADLYLLNKKALPAMNREYLKTELERLGISSFVEEMSAVAKKWFEDNDFTEFSGTEMYILQSGTYGTERNKIINRRNSLGDEHFILKRLFPPMKKMKIMFAPVRRLPFLAPVFYVYRIFLLIIPSRRRRIQEEIKILNESKTNNQNNEY